MSKYDYEYQGSTHHFTRKKKPDDNWVGFVLMIIVAFVILAQCNGA